MKLGLLVTHDSAKNFWLLGDWPNFPFTYLSCDGVDQPDVQVLFSSLPWNEKKVN